MSGDALHAGLASLVDRNIDQRKALEKAAVAWKGHCDREQMWEYRAVDKYPQTRYLIGSGRCRNVDGTLVRCAMDVCGVR